MRNIDYFDKSAALYPERPVLETQQGAITYAAMQRMTHRLAGAMAAAGLQPQEAVAIMSPNHPGVLTAMLSLWRAGAVWIPVNTRNALPDTIAYLRYVRAGWLFYHSSLSAEAHEAARQVPSIRHLICLDAPDAGNPCLDGFMLPPDAPPFPDLGGPDGGDRELCAIIATGGTTGPAKGVRALNRSWGTMLESIAILMAVEEIPVFLATAPLSHAAGPFALAGIAMGATIVMLPAFDAHAVMEAIQTHRVTHMFLPPTALYSMLAHPDVRHYNYSSMRYFLLAGSACSPEKLRQAVEVFGPCLCQSYGQTEFHLIATWLPPEIVAAAAAGDHPERLASCGRATMSVRLELMDDDGALLPVGEVGEIVGRGGIVCDGYFEMEEATTEVRTHGWHHTGDVGRRDEHGFFYIVDRKKDMIVTGGFNVFCSEVEAAVSEMAGVHECAAIGIPDEKWGEAVSVLVVANSVKAPDAAAIMAHCKARLGSVKAPKHVFFRDSLPRTPVGKFDKKAMRAEFWQGQSRSVN